MKNQRLIFIISVIVMLVSLIGCAQAAPTPDQAPAAQPAQTEAPAAQPAQTEAPAVSAAEPHILVIAMPSTPPTLDNEFVIHPMVLAFQPNVYDTLIAYDKVKSEERGILEADIFTPKFVPSLAESWEVSEDGTVYTFNLRKGVKSCVGNEMTADDVYWTYERKLTLGGNSLLNMHLAGINTKDQIKVIDPYTVQITTDQYRPMFEHVHTLFFSNSIWDSKEVKNHVTADDPWAKEWLDTHAAGYGPYCVSEFTSGQQLVLKANPEYWGGTPYYTDVIWKEVPVSANRLALLLQGEVDIAYGLTPRERQELKDKDAIRVVFSPSNNFIELAFNNETEPFDNKELRKALSYAGPYDAILETVYFGEARLRKSIVPDIYPGYTDESSVYNTDLDKAKQMLADAGYPDGLDITLSYDVVDPEAEQVAILVKSNWEKIGVKTTLDKLPSANFADRQGTRKLPAFIWSEQPIYPDVGFAIWLWFHDENFPAWSEYKNAEMEQIFIDADNQKDQEKRYEMYKGLQNTLMNDMPVIPIAWRGWYLPMKADIQGYTWYPDNTTHFAELYK